MEKLLLFDIDGTIFNTKKPFNLYSDVLEYLPRFSREKIGIFSQGIYTIQMLKLKFHRIDKYFKKDAIYMSLNKLSLLEKIEAEHADSKIFIVDNRRDIIEAINLSNSGIKGMLLDRDGTEIDYKGIRITSIEELWRLYFASKRA